MEVVINIMCEDEGLAWSEAKKIEGLGYRVTADNVLKLERYGEANKYVIVLKK